MPDILTRNRTESDVEEELQFHLDMLERKYAQVGMCAAEAKAAAVKRFGNFQIIKRQCVDISRRKSVLRRVLKTSSILIALAGLSIRLLTPDPRIARIGAVLIMIAIFGRLLLYVRGLVPSTFFPRNNDASLSVVTDPPADGSNLREA